MNGAAVAVTAVLSATVITGGGVVIAWKRHAKPWILVATTTAFVVQVIVSAIGSMGAPAGDAPLYAMVIGVAQLVTAVEVGIVQALLTALSNIK